MWLEKINAIVENIAKWLEVLGFILSAFAAFKVYFLNDDLKKLYAKHLFQVRSDEQVDDLKKSSRRIANLINDFHINIREIKIEISKSLQHCQSIEKKVVSSELATLKPLIKKIKKVKKRLEKNQVLSALDKLLNRKLVDENDIDSIYIDLTALITEIEQYNKDLKKRI